MQGDIPRLLEWHHWKVLIERPSYSWRWQRGPDGDGCGRHRRRAPFCGICPAVRTPLGKSNCADWFCPLQQTHQQRSHFVRQPGIWLTNHRTYQRGVARRVNFNRGGRKGGDCDLLCGVRWIRTADYWPGGDSVPCIAVINGPSSGNAALQSEPGRLSRGHPLSAPHPTDTRKPVAVSGLSPTAKWRLFDGRRISG